MTKEYWLNSWQVKESFLFCTISRPVLVSTKLPVQCPCPWTFLPLKTRPVCCIETLGTNHLVMCHIPEEHCESLKTCRNGCSVLYWFLFLRQLIEQEDMLTFHPVVKFPFLTSQVAFELLQCLILTNKTYFLCSLSCKRCLFSVYDF
jgi:hypothetical protein